MKIQYSPDETMPSCINNICSYNYCCNDNIIFCGDNKGKTLMYCLVIVLAILLVLVATGHLGFQINGNSTTTTTNVNVSPNGGNPTTTTTGNGPSDRGTPGLQMNGTGDGFYYSKNLNDKEVNQLDF